jgi:hypothetical protein
MGQRLRCALVTGMLFVGGIALAGCETHSEAIANPCPNASSVGAPQEPKVGLTPDEQKAQDECSSSNETKDKVCSDIEALKSSVGDVKNVDVVQNGTSGIQVAVDKVKENADTLRADSNAALQPAVDQLRSSLTTLRSSIENVVANGTSQVKTALQNARQSARNLEDQARTLYKC